MLGYSKPLVLEEVDSLVFEDEANRAYQKFVLAWESLSLLERGLRIIYKEFGSLDCS
ncbi:hypothetical protein MTR_6g061020 [Medicago truncatula]|uniref:Uncharacterized protein n=1 Tax=Medicago truncatula TaxID=3880 RepID=G7KNE8_MEDTR|nr:hypothetical protein MTR_6g061020 [Medicago truncatula]